LIVDPHELLQSISDAELKARAERLRVWQKKTSSWDSIAAQFADTLQFHSRGTAQR
jgi:hypothetical protein